MKFPYADPTTIIYADPAIKCDINLFSQCCQNLIRPKPTNTA